MSDVIPFGSSIPPHLFDDEPHTLIYDRGRLVQNPINQLQPFGSLVRVYHQELAWADALNQLQNTQLVIILIFPTETEVEIRGFIKRYALNQSHLHSLFLIFHNGLQYHEQWHGNLLSTLRWCRSLTNELISDILDACQIACNLHISFYEQRRKQAEDNILHNNGASGIAALFTHKKRECSLMLLAYLEASQNAND